jgi:hypothetical protein
LLNIFDEKQIFNIRVVKKYRGLRLNGQFIYNTASNPMLNVILCTNNEHMNGKSKIDGKIHLGPWGTGGRR